MRGTLGPLGLLPAEGCDLDRPVLRDPVLDAELVERGYVVVPFLDRSEVESLRQGYETEAHSAEGVNPPGAYNDTFAEFTVIHSRPEFRRRVFETITDVFGRHTDDLLRAYRPLFANFVNKPPGTGVVPAHQNFSVADESRYRSVSVWVPLVDCTVDNGAMWMLDGSHARLRGRRGMWSYQTFGAVEAEMVERLLTPLEVEAGAAVVLDDALVHYSPPNTTGRDRLAIQYVMLPDEADALWFQQVGGGGDAIDVDVWRVEPPFFFDFWHGDGDESHGERVGRVEVPTPALDIETLIDLLASPTA